MKARSRPRPPRLTPGLPLRYGGRGRRVPLRFLRYTLLRYRWHCPHLEKRPDKEARVRKLHRIRWGWVARLKA